MSAKTNTDRHLTFGQQIAADYEAAQRLADDMRAAFAEDRRSRIRLSPQHTLRASSFGYDCDRRIYHDVVNWQEKAPIDEVVQGYFDRGNDMEPIVERKLTGLGFRIIQSQVALWDEELKMSMHPDGQIVEDRSGRPIVVDIKSTMDQKLLACRTVEDLWENKWGKRYIPQLTLYMRKQSIYGGLLIPWDGINWLPEPIPIPYDVGIGDWLAQRASRINACIEAKTPPPYIEDSRECRYCPHLGRACSPPISFGKGAQMIDDEVVVDDLLREREIRDTGEEWTRLKKGLKDRFRAPKDDPQDGFFICGGFEIRRKIRDRKGYVVNATKTQTITWEHVSEFKVLGDEKGDSKS